LDAVDAQFTFGGKVTRTEPGIQALLEEVVAEFSRLPEVKAVVLSGSKGGESTDGYSDIDLYVYAKTEPSKTWRAELAQKFGNNTSIGNEFWEPGDEWIANSTGTVVDIMYRTPAWIAEQLDRVLNRHQASVGYSTCFVHNVHHSRVFYDCDGWFESLRKMTQRPYAEALRKAIIAKNHPILRSTLSSYLHQIEVALIRRDLPSLNHRITAMLASYFDILFAVNRVFHPGEKRLLAYALAKCHKRPPRIEVQVNTLLTSIAETSQPLLLQRANELLDGLDLLLVAEGLMATE
jgi:Domain of unknown function (DUF4037)